MTTLATHSGTLTAPLSQQPVIIIVSIINPPQHPHTYVRGKITGRYLMQGPAKRRKAVPGPAPLMQSGTQMLMKEIESVVVLKGTGHCLELQEHSVRGQLVHVL